MSLFTPVPTKIGDLLNKVESGEIGLPDLQRKFVWKDAVIRDLLDSMLKGYPVGHIMLWDFPSDYHSVSTIGEQEHAYPIKSLVIDGQQRLTGLLAAIRGVSVKDENFRNRRIRIAFNPLTRTFEVWSQAYERSAEWIGDIGLVFQAVHNGNIAGFRRRFMKELADARQRTAQPPLTDEDEECIEQNIQDVVNLRDYVLPSLEISSSATEEDVAEIFVRVNSGGKKLTEKNFIETLLAVYDPNTHTAIQSFCESARVPAMGTAYNFIIDVDPSHLIRIAVAVAFRRARLRYAYMLLRGKNLETGEMTDERRDDNLSRFRAALDKAMDINEWHSFLNLFIEAGYVVKNLVASENAVVFSYALYLIGKYDYGVSVAGLKKIITKWIFMATITGFYTGSTESEVEKQMADFRSIDSADGFVDYLEKMIASRFTDDYFNVTLLRELENSSANAPAWFGFVAALNVLNAPMWLGHTPLATYLQPGTNGTVKALDRHHIFPKEHLAEIGITDDRQRNQIANFTFVEKSVNIRISDSAPSVYAPMLREEMGDIVFDKSCDANAIPRNFDKISFQDFLVERRKMMVCKIREAYDRL